MKRVVTVLLFTTLSVFAQDKKLEIVKPAPVRIPAAQLQELRSKNAEAQNAAAVYNIVEPLLIDKESGCNKQVLATLRRSAELKASDYGYLLERAARETGAPLGYTIDLQSGVFVAPTKESNK